jgi:aryl-alcohol dehydrogenase-like predicted oxidoreductase
MMVYTPLAQGLLTGKYGETLSFDEDDVRRKKWYFKPENYHKSLEFIEKLRIIGKEHNLNLMQAAIGWTLKDKTVATALCGAKTKEQIDGIVEAMDVNIPDQVVSLIEDAYKSCF